VQAEGEWSNKVRHCQSDLHVRFSLQAGQVEAADTRPLPDQSDMLLMDRCVCVDSVAGFLATQRHVLAMFTCCDVKVLCHDVHAITSVQVLCVKYAQLCMQN